MREIKIGNKYHHFKGENYIVTDIVYDSESTNNNLKKIVIYQALYGDKLKWAREYDNFNSKMDIEKYPNVTQKYRFEEIKTDDT